MKSTAKTSVQKLGNGTYRVGSARGRSAISGRFVTQSAAATSPKSTVTEVKKK